MPPNPLTRLQRVVVLAGGGSRRLGQDKLAADLGGRTVLDALLDALRESMPNDGARDADVVLVGPDRPRPGSVLRVREEPPGGGPVAGLAAGLVPDLGRGLDDDDLVAVLAGDQPFAAVALPMLTTAALGDVDGAIGVDPDGRDQPLLAVYRAGPLRRAVGPQPAGARVRDVVARLTLARTHLPAQTTLDVDTAADLEHAREVVRRERGARRP